LVGAKISSPAGTVYGALGFIAGREDFLFRPVLVHTFAQAKRHAAEGKHWHAYYRLKVTPS
jgi:hypothetical protein